MCTIAGPRLHVRCGATLRSPITPDTQHKAVMGARNAAAARGRACGALKKALLGGSDLEVTNACIGTMVR